ncbi:MAG: hypothetical protein KVP17_000979 [Porospora cf. gigantea B]|uniref:uncharacterized protein n=1 Tax=Porospora cf. gigantea B TaxID=2853592 RepID=UPI003571EF3F|nr:MAG: hypothetical protein KVP17_000979 [Porospora cf. gigantea B]
MVEIWGDDSDFFTSDEETTAAPSVPEPVTDTEGPSIEGDDLTQPLTVQDEEAIQGLLAEMRTARYGQVVQSDIPAACQPFTVSGTVPSPAPPSITSKKEVAIRKDWCVHDTSDVEDFHKRLPKSEMVIQFPFELDVFQKRAIWHVHNHRHVMVAAHTSAGKTVTAEYAIAQSENEGLRVVYTSPIKALSNQKFRDFTHRFSSVGIITGDVVINPEAQCLIMTTEILRTMLYRGDPLINQLAYVVFDEVHYVSDPDRGLVWEECIILMPDHISMLMLSATVPNFKDFAGWVGRTKQREIFTVMTSFRPIPLKHHFFCLDKSIELADNSGRMNPNAYHALFARKAEATKKRQEKEASKRGGRGGRGVRGGRGARGGGRGPTAKTLTGAALSQRIRDCLKMIQKDEHFPTIVFSFSRKDCMTFGRHAAGLDLTTGDEKSKIIVFINDSLKLLPEEDRQLPQIQQVIDMVHRGIGVHHGGLLPIVKEIVEILFSRGLVKVLFATETFAMGVNMPARTVMFTGLEKFDGYRRRFLLSSEYTQMAGRAGRRGLDDYGRVYVIVDENYPPEQLEILRMLETRSAPICSQFKVTFHSLLQVCARSAGLQPEDILAKSYCENNRATAQPLMHRDLIRQRRRLEDIEDIECVVGAPTIAEYVDAEITHRNVGRELFLQLYRDDHDAFAPGRVVVAHSICGEGSVPGILLGEHTVKAASPLFFLLTAVPATTTCSGRLMGEGTMASESRHRVVLFSHVGLDSMSLISNTSANAQVSDDLIRALLRALEAQSDSKAVDVPTFEALERLGASSLLLTSLAMELDRNLALEQYRSPRKSKNLSFQHLEAVVAIDKAARDLRNNKCHTCSLRESHFGIELGRYNTQKEIERLRLGVSPESMALLPQLRSRLKFLKKKGLLRPATGRVTKKGRIAGELVSSDELTLIEVLFSNILSTLSVPETCALLSCFVCPDGNKEKGERDCETLPDSLRESLAEVDALHWKLGDECLGMGITLTEHDWARTFNMGIAPIILWWAEGKPFADIMEAQDNFQEGNIVRTVLRLDELLKKLKATAAHLGNSQLELKLAECSRVMHRDVVFSVSLYLKRR